MQKVDGNGNQGYNENKNDTEGGKNMMLLKPEDIEKIGTGQIKVTQKNRELAKIAGLKAKESSSKDTSQTPKK